jgi:hypothetical protein
VEEQHYQILCGSRIQVSIQNLDSRQVKDFRLRLQEFGDVFPVDNRIAVEIAHQRH